LNDFAHALGLLLDELGEISMAPWERLASCAGDSFLHIRCIERARKRYAERS